MVEQSELAFRLLTKRYGAQLTYSPMVHARILTERGASSEQWVRELLTAPGDRPMIVQVRFEKYCDVIQGLGTRAFARHW